MVIQWTNGRKTGYLIRLKQTTILLVCCVVLIVTTGCVGQKAEIDKSSKKVQKDVRKQRDNSEGEDVDQSVGADIETDESVTAGTELAGLQLYPDSAEATYKKFDFKEGDAQIHIQIDVVANGAEQEVIAWYQNNLATELARRGWAVDTIEMNAEPEDNSVRETSIMCNKGSDGVGDTFVNIFFEKSTGTKTPVRIVYQGPMPAN